jgi:hypothetical protein
VKSADLEPSVPGVQYIVEFIAVSAHDSSVVNQHNNASYREATIGGGPIDFTAAVAGVTHREQPAIHVWAASDAGVFETIVPVPGDGVLILAAKATELGDGLWHYEYALQNVNADVGVNSFTVPVPNSAKLANIGFHDVDYHSGDGIPLPDGPDADTDPDWRNFDGTDWETTSPAEPGIAWMTSSFAEDPNANALRWGTLYNFRFDASVPPSVQKGQVIIGTFKDAGTLLVETLVPGTPTCIGDVTGGDGAVTIDDLLVIITYWGQTPPAFPGADVTGDGTVNIDDLLAVIGAWGPCE